MRSLLLVLCFLIFVLNTSAQLPDSSTTTPYQNVYGFTVMNGTMLVHSKKMENVRGAKPKGFEIEISKLNTKYATYSNWGFLTRSGFTFSYFNFNTPILGSTYNFGYFIEPIFQLGNRVQFRIRGAVGIGYLTNPNPDLADTSSTANYVYGTHINSSLQLSVATSVSVTKHVSAFVRGTFSHNSNAGFAIPNLGTNYPSVGLGVLYHQTSNRLPHFIRIKDYSWKKYNPVRYEVGGFFTGKDGWTGVGAKYKKQLLIGAHIVASKKVSNVNALTIGLEAYYDGGIAFTKKVINDPAHSYYASVLMGNEFFLNRITLSTQVGFHIIKNTDYYNKEYLLGLHQLKTVYQRYGVSYNVTDKYKIGFSLLARLNVADFFDFRLAYRLK